jgi:hypothetical protein
VADGVFNIAKGRGVEWYSIIKSNHHANSAFIVVLLKATGLEADDVLNNYDDLSALLAAANDQADFTNYARKTLTDVELAALPVPDDTNNRRDLDVPDQVWLSAGGGVNNSLGKLLVCYDDDTTAGTDANIIPWTYHDFVVTTDGTDLTAQINTAGLFRAA